MFRNKGFNAVNQYRSFLLFISLSMMLMVSGAVQAELSAMDWVQKMSRSMQELSYKGRFVFSHGNQLESMSILHVNDSMGKRERLVSLNGEAREILRDNKNFTCVWPSSRQVVVDQSNSNNFSPIWIPEDVTRLGKYYKFTIEGDDRVADHPAVMVSISPKDEYRYGMKLWIQKNNGLLLQSVLYDERGLAREQIMFTDLSLMHYDDQKSFSVIPNIDSGYALIRSHSGEGGNQLEADARWQLQMMPGGFFLETSFRKKMMDSANFTQQMILTDGMASVSVFIEPFSESSLMGESSMGAVNAYGTQVDKFSVLAIGEVPPVTVKQIVESISFSQ